MRLSNFAVDSKKANEGTWVQVGEGLEILIARLGNEKYKKFLRSAGKGLSVQVRTGNMNLEQAAELQKLAVANTVLLGWKGLEGDDGKPVEYSVQKAVELFNTHQDFYDLVVEYANDASMFKAQVQEDARGN